MNTRDIFLTRNRCNVDVAVDIPLAKGTLRKLNVGISMNREGHIVSMARKHYFNLQHEWDKFGRAMHRTGNKESRSL